MHEQLINLLSGLTHFQPDRPMFYTGMAFWVVFLLIIGFYSFFYRNNRWRNVYLLAVSLYIYHQINGAFLAMLVFSCLSNYGFGMLIERFRKTKFWIIAAISFNLLLLAYFKYTYFFVKSYNDWFGTSYQVFNAIGWLLNQVREGVADVHSIVLPIGISFYTFQAISYLADVRMRRVAAVRNVFDFSFYLAFFPQSVSGPIVRASSFVPQLYKSYRLNREELSHATFLIMKGLIKKMILADFLSLNFVDRIFDAPAAYSGLEGLLAVWGYAIQIYCDFSGYTDIAIGLALMLGFRIPINFNSPYHAASLTDFWRRWHISLSFWLRDYLYIPLGGSRKGKLRTYVNLMVTMVLGGMWHGASWRFVIWGAIHGLVLSIEKLFPRWIKPPEGTSFAVRLLKIFVTFQVVSLAWIFFRSPDMDTVRQLFFQFRHHFIPSLTADGVREYAPTMVMLVLGFILIGFPCRMKERIRGAFINLPLAVQALVCAAVFVLIQAFATADIQPFIYFRF